MASNARLIDDLVRARAVRANRSALFGLAPGPMPTGFDFGRTKGMMLGHAIGDALGNATESMFPADRARAHGEIRGYLVNRHAGGRGMGLPSDDSQLAFWTLEQLLADGCLIPERLAQICATRRIFDVGSAMAEFVGNARAGLSWYGCGAALTHNDPASTAACVAFVLDAVATAHHGSPP